MSRNAFPECERELADYKLWAEVEIADLRDDVKRLRGEDTGGEVMRIELKCACGAESVFASTTFINSGGHPDGKGHVYVVELRAEEWQEEHRHHATMKFTGASYER